MKLLFFTLIFYIGLALFVFGRLPETFFQQDEWAIVGNFLYWEKANLGWFTRLFVYEQDTHMIPFGNAFSYMQFVPLGLTFAPYAVVSIGLHVFNSILVVILAKQLFQSKAISFLAGLFFLINATTHQAVTWTATSAGTGGSTFFVLLSLIFFQRHLEKTVSPSWNLVVSLGMFLVSLGFKETSIFLFVFYPIFWFLVSKKRTTKGFITLFVSLLLLGVLYAGGRLFISQFWTVTASTPSELSQPSLDTYVYRFFSNPIKIFTQTLLPVPVLLKIARQIVILGYPQLTSGQSPDPYVVESVASDIVSFSFVVAIAMIFFVYYQFTKRKGLDADIPPLVASIAFIITSAIPFLIIPGKAGYISLFDGRHLYLTSIFVSIMLAVLAVRIYERSGKRSFITLGIVFPVVIFLSLHALKIRRDIAYLVAVGELRRSILTTITSAYPSLPKKIVFYIESDKAYYGLPPEETIVPFQSGFGQTLLVWYNAHGENFPACFFERKFLYALTSEGYRECDGRGFGYYRSFHTLKEFVRSSRINPKLVVGFRFHSSTNIISEITL